MYFSLQLRSYIKVNGCCRTPIGPTGCLDSFFGSLAASRLRRRKTAEISPDTAIATARTRVTADGIHSSSDTDPPRSCHRRRSRPRHRRLPQHSSWTPAGSRRCCVCRGAHKGKVNVKPILYGNVMFCKGKYAIFDGNTIPYLNPF